MNDKLLTTRMKTGSFGGLINELSRYWEQVPESTPVIIVQPDETGMLVNAKIGEFSGMSYFVLEGRPILCVLLSARGLIDKEKAIQERNLEESL